MIIRVRVVLERRSKVGEYSREDCRRKECDGANRESLGGSVNPGFLAFQRTLCREPSGPGCRDADVSAGESEDSFAFLCSIFPSRLF
jgi:hypothetical protein